MFIIRNFIKKYYPILFIIILIIVDSIRTIYSLSPSTIINNEYNKVYKHKIIRKENYKNRVNIDFENGGNKLFTDDVFIEDKITSRIQTGDTVQKIKHSNKCLIIKPNGDTLRFNCYNYDQLQNQK